MSPLHRIAPQTEEGPLTLLSQLSFALEEKLLASLSKIYDCCVENRNELNDFHNVGFSFVRTCKSKGFAQAAENGNGDVCCSRSKEVGIRPLCTFYCHIIHPCRQRICAESLHSSTSYRAFHSS